MTRVFIVCLGVILGSGAGLAADLDEAQTLYRGGNMLEAARIARAAGTAEGFALASKATLVDGLYLAPEHERAALFERAADDADRALQLEPNHIDAMLRLAVALGHIAKSEDPVSAHLKGYGRQGRELLERALALEPDHPWANGLLGIWHLQVVAKGGAMLARELYGASESEGRRLCRRALELEPDANSIRFGCARSLLDLDRVANEATALEDLHRVVEAPAQDVPSRLLRDEAWKHIEDIRRAAAG